MSIEALEAVLIQAKDGAASPRDIADAIDDHVREMAASGTLHACAASGSPAVFVPGYGYKAGFDAPTPEAAMHTPGYYMPPPTPSSAKVKKSALGRGLEALLSGRDWAPGDAPMSDADIRGLFEEARLAYPSRAFDWEREQYAAHKAFELGRRYVVAARLAITRAGRDTEYVTADDVNQLKDAYDALQANAQAAQIELDAMKEAFSEQLLQLANYEEILKDHRRLERELDMTIHGVQGAAPQVSLCDLIAPVEKLVALTKEKPVRTETIQRYAWRLKLVPRGCVVPAQMSAVLYDQLTEAQAVLRDEPC